MKDEAFDLLALIREILATRNTENARLTYNLACLVDAAERYSGCVGHRRGCRFDKCDCGYEQLTEALAMVRQ